MRLLQDERIYTNPTTTTKIVNFRSKHIYEGKYEREKW